VIYVTPFNRGRSPPQLLTEAAHGCLEPPPTRRLRRVHLHLSYSRTLSRLLDTTSRRTGREPLGSSGSHQATNTPVERLVCLSHASKSSCFQLPRSCNRLTRPLRSGPITSLPRSYESVRPSAPHRYARLAVLAAWASPFTSERLVPAVPRDSLHPL